LLSAQPVSTALDTTVQAIAKSQLFISCLLYESDASIGFAT
jgi:hypothetical protein